MQSILKAKKSQVRTVSLLAFLLVAALLISVPVLATEAAATDSGIATASLVSPVAGWPLDDGGTGGGVRNEVAGGVGGSNGWGTWLPNETFGTVLDFSTYGSNVYIANTGVSLGNNFSVSAWIKAPVRESHDRVIIMQGDRNSSGTTLQGLCMYLDYDQGFALNFEAKGMTIGGNSGVGLVDGKWHHVLVSINGSSLTYYIDGAAVKTVSVSGTFRPSNSYFMIGSDVSGNRGFDGSVAEVRLFNQAVTPAQATSTVLNANDNVAKQPRLDLQKGITLDRRQYSSARPAVYEGQTVTENDIINCINMGFDHVKVLLSPHHVMDSNGNLIESNMAYITEVLNYIKKHNFKGVLCIHPEDNFKQTYMGSEANFNILLKWYEQLATYVGARWDADTIAIQLMTEPDHDYNTNAGWTWMSDRMYTSVRNALPYHTIWTSSNERGHIENLKTMSPATDDNLVYTFTTYEPYTIGWYFYNTTVGEIDAWGYVHDIPYPIEAGVDYTSAIEYAINQVPSSMKSSIRTQLWAYVNGEYDGAWAERVNLYDSLYNANWHMLRAESLHAWRWKYGGNIHIMCVEFGCMDAPAPARIWQSAAPCYGISDAKRVEFVGDVVESFEYYDIDWTYWSYNEAHTIFKPFLHSYGASPSPDAAKNMFDYDMLINALGVTPLVSADKELVGETFDSSWLVIDAFDVNSGWGGTGVEMGYSNPPAGYGYVKSSYWDADGVSVFFKKYSNSSFNVSAYSNGYAHVWLYIDDISKFKDGYVELCSGGAPDTYETSWRLIDYVKKSGWNELYLPLSKASQNTANLSAIDYVRVLFVTDGTAEVGVDSFYLCHEAQGSKPSDAAMINGVSGTTGWSTSPTASYTTAGGHVDGAGWLKAEATSATTFSFFNNTFGPVNASAYSNGYLHLWLYVSNKSNVTAASVELTSSGSVDANEINWDLTGYIVQNGWNELYLPMEKATASNGAINMSSVNCIRILVTMTSGSCGINEIFMTNKGAEDPFVISQIETVELWTTNATPATPTVMTSGAPAGSVWLKSATAGDAVFSSAFAPLNLTPYAKDGYLHIWLYTPNASLIVGGQIELSSAGAADASELSWNLNDLKLKTGWNELFLPIKDGNKVNGTTGAINLANVNYIRIYANQSSASYLGLDKIYVTNQNPAEIDMITVKSVWTGSANSYTTDKGHSSDAGWLLASAGANENVELFKTFDARNLSGYSDGYLHMWLYVNNVAGLKDNSGMIEITSSGKVDTNELYWSIGDYVYKNGWNELYLPFSEGTASGGAIDLTKVNCMRVVGMFNENGGAIGIDEIYATSNNPAAIDMITSGSTMDGTYTTTGGHKSGAGWSKISAAVNSDAVFYKSFSKDLSAYANGYLHMWIYVDNISNLRAGTGGMIELTSSGKVDTEEIYWNICDYVKQTGWNEVYLPIASANTEGGAIDLTQVDTMRIVGMFGANGGVMGIDELVLTNYLPEHIDLIYADSVWTGSANSYVTTGGYTTNAGWLKATASANSAVQFFGTFPAKDFTDYANGYVHLRLYVDSLSKLTSGTVELTSAGTVDKEEIYWNLADYVYANGWNELYLPIASASAQGTIDLSGVNCMRIVGNFNASGVMGIDDIYVTSTNPAILDMVTGDNNWDSTANIYQTTGGYDANAGWLKAQSAGTADIVYSRLFNASDVSAYANGYLHIWFYVDDVAKLKAYGGMIELTSAGKCDDEELFWNISEYVHKSGWNELYLPVASANKQGNNSIDLTQVDCMRIVAMVDYATVVGIDEVYMTNKQPAPSGILDMITAASAWSKVPNYKTVGGYVNGAGWLLESKTEQGDIVFMRNFNATNLSSFSNGYLHLWLYIDNKANLQSYAGMIEITSSGNTDKEELFWNISEYVHKSGWNELYLPISAANTEGGAIDLTQVDTMRIVGMVGANGGVMGIDEVYMTNEKPAASEIVNVKLWDLESQNAGADIGTITYNYNANTAISTVEVGVGVLGSKGLAYTISATNFMDYTELLTLNLANVGFNTTTAVQRDQILWFWADADLTSMQRLQITINDSRMTIDPSVGGILYTISKGANGKPVISEMNYQFDMDYDVNGMVFTHETSNEGDTSLYAGPAFTGSWSGWIGIPVNYFYESMNNRLEDGETLTKLEIQAYWNWDLDGTVEPASGDSICFDEFWLTSANTMPNLTDEALLYRGARFSGASVELKNDISVNFKMNESFVNMGFTDPYVVFELNGYTRTVEGVYDETNGVYVFPFTSIQPDWMGDTIIATLYATYTDDYGDEYLRELEVREYSVAQYCYNILNKNYSSATTSDKLSTLLVNMLNYGAAAQVYTNHNTDALVTDDLTSTWRSWITTSYTAQAPDTAISKDLENPEVQLKSATLFLRETVRIRLRLTAASIDGLSLKVTDLSGKEIATLTEENFIVSGGSVYIFFDGMIANQMRTPIKMTIYKNGVAVSNTLTYSIRSYADKEILKDSTTTLAKLMQAMMVYGDAAVAYTAK